MIANAKEWAQARGLLRQNEVHRADEFRIPTSSSFSYENARGRSIEGSGTGTMEDPEGTLLNFSDMSEEITVSQLGYISTVHPLPRRGASSTTSQAVLTAAASARVQALPMLQQSVDPFSCSAHVYGPSVHKVSWGLTSRRWARRWTRSMIHRSHQKILNRSIDLKLLQEKVAKIDTLRAKELLGARCRASAVELTEAEPEPQDRAHCLQVMLREAHEVLRGSCYGGSPFGSWQHMLRRWL